MKVESVKIFDVIMPEYHLSIMVAEVITTKKKFDWNSCRFTSSRKTKIVSTISTYGKWESIDGSGRISRRLDRKINSYINTKGEMNG